MLPGLRPKIILAILATLLFTLGGNYFVNTSFFTRSYTQSLENRMLAIGKTLALQLESILLLDIPLTELTGFNDQVQELVQNYPDISQAMVTDHHGTILFHSQPGLVGSTITSPQILSAIKDGQQVALVSDYYSVVVPVHDPTKVVTGSVILQIPRNLVATQQRTLLYQTTAISIATVVVSGLLLSYLLNRWITVPLKHVLDTIASIRNSNDLSQTITLNSPDEIGALAHQFNSLLSQLSTSHQSLENQVKSRTVELDQKVALLETSNVSLENIKKAVLNLLEDAKELETQLQAERDRATAIISSMGEGLLAVDHQANITIINPAAEKLLDTTAAAAAGHPWSQIVTTLKTDQQVPTPERSFSRVLDSGQTIVTTADDNHYYKTATGRVFPIASVTAPLKDGSGQVIGAVKVFRDITHDKAEKTFIEKVVQERTWELHQKNTALEAAKTQISAGWLDLQREKAKLTASLASLPIGFIITDPQESILYHNPATLSILGISKAPEKFVDIEQLLSPGCNLHDLHQQARSQNSSVEVPSLLFGSKYLHLYLTPITLVTDHDEYVGTAILLQDVTEAKVLERSKDEFFSIASHELRTPLTAIRGNTSMIKQFYGDKMQTDPDLASMIDDINASSVRLINIVNDFLNMSRLEQGRMEFKKETFDLTSVVKDVIKELEPGSLNKTIYLKLADEATPPYTVNSDKDKVKEVLVNLIGNSFKFTETGGVDISLVPQDHQVKVLVHDTGRGIPASQQALLFHKFQQAGDSLLTRDTTKGTGLGLYISKLIIEGLGGRIGLDWSEPSRGSTFFFTLPA